MSEDGIFTFVRAWTELYFTVVCVDFIVRKLQHWMALYDKAVVWISCVPLSISF